MLAYHTYKVVTKRCLSVEISGVTVAVNVLTPMRMA